MCLFCRSSCQNGAFWAAIELLDKLQICWFSKCQNVSLFLQWKNTHFVSNHEKVLICLPQVVGVTFYIILVCIFRRHERASKMWRKTSMMWVSLQCHSREKKIRVKCGEKQAWCENHCTIWQTHLSLELNRILPWQLIGTRCDSLLFVFLTLYIDIYCVYWCILCILMYNVYTVRLHIDTHIIRWDTLDRSWLINHNFWA